MIEVQQARSGQEYYIYDGKPLASRNDPNAEAAQWVEQVSHRVRGCKSVIILGAGSGYHIVALATQFSSLPIFVLDPRKDLIERVRARWGLALSHIQFGHQLQDIPDRMLSNSFISLRHMSSWLSKEDWFLSAEKYLSGRFGAGFMRQKQLRPAFCNSRLLKMSESQPLTVHDLVAAIEMPSLEATDAASLLILGELIR